MTRAAALGNTSSNMPFFSLSQLARAFGGVFLVQQCDFHNTIQPISPLLVRLCSLLQH